MIVSLTAYMILALNVLKLILPEVTQEVDSIALNFWTSIAYGMIGVNMITLPHGIMTYIGSSLPFANSKLIQG